MARDTMLDALTRKVGWLIFNLLYLWLRDSGLPLTPETGAYLQSHFSTLWQSDELEFSDQEIVDFIYEYLGGRERGNG